MAKKSNKVLHQSGVIPFVIRNNKIRLLIITSTSGKKWIFPKGIVEKGMSKEESAMMEAFEEAGVMGEILDRNLGSYKLEKYNTICKVDMYPMIVEKVLKEWPEIKMRKRKWIHPEDIEDYVTDKKLLRVTRKFIGREYCK